jgi:hypothetical protein
MIFEEFLEALTLSKEIIDWRLMVLRPDSPYSNGIIDGQGTDRTLSKPKMGIIYEGIKGKFFCPTSAVYYLATGKFISPPNYFYSTQSRTGRLDHPQVDKALGVDRAFGHRMAVASFNWNDSHNYYDGDREKLLGALGLEEYVYKPKTTKKKEQDVPEDEAAGD